VNERAGQESVEQIATNDLTPEERRACGDMIFRALPQFYELLPLPRETVCDILAGQIGKSGTEMEEAYILRSGDAILATLTAVPADRFAAAKKNGLFSLLRHVPRSQTISLTKAMAAFESRVCPAPANGLYLARLGVSGEGVLGSGTRLLRSVLAERPEQFFSLHVHHANPAAWLYRKLGFVYLPEDQYEFRCMVLDRAASG
jgi:hypothetical protein